MLGRVLLDRQPPIGTTEEKILKKYIIWACAVLLSSSVFGALYVEEGSDRSLRTASDVVIWNRTPVIIESEVLAYRDAWKIAFKQPGTLVPVYKAYNEVELVGLWKAKVRTISSVGIIRTTGDSPTIKVVRDQLIREDERLSVFYLAWAIALFSMATYAWQVATARTIMGRDLKGVCIGTAVGALLLGTFTDTVLHTMTASLAMAFSVVVILIAGMSSSGVGRLLASGIYLCCAAIHLGTMLPR